MSQAQVDLLDFKLAWQRVRDDQQEDHIFIRHPYEIVLVEIELDTWLEGIKEQIRTDTFQPGPFVVCDVPKGKGTVRPGGYLSLIDQVVYAACVGACLSSIQKELEWARGTVDFAYQINSNVLQPDWLRHRFKCWEEYREKSIAKMSTGVSYVVITDIAGYYENIDFSLLSSYLRQIGVPNQVLDLLFLCLNKWALIGRKGIPQGFSASHILAKLYLNSVDQNLKSMGYDHHRFVDDYRIFCQTKDEAKRALVDLSQLLRARGLILQGAKTEIVRADEARRQIDKVVPELKVLKDEFIREIVEAIGLKNSHISLAQAEEMFAQIHDDDEPIEVIRKAYKAYFIDGGGEFDKTLFHFFLNRLKKKKDDFAIPHAVSLLGDYPEETIHILRYIGAVGAVTRTDETLAKYIVSPEAVYPYQIYQIVEWRSMYTEESTSDLTLIVRQLAFGNTPAYVKAACRKFLSKFGTIADLERLMQEYTSAQGVLEQIEILCSLTKMEPQRRNSLLALHAKDSEFHKRAIKLVRAGKV